MSRRLRRNPTQLKLVSELAALPTGTLLQSGSSYYVKDGSVLRPLNAAGTIMPGLVPSMAVAKGMTFDLLSMGAGKAFTPTKAHLLDLYGYAEKESKESAAYEASMAAVTPAAPAPALPEAMNLQAITDRIELNLESFGYASARTNSVRITVSTSKMLIAVNVLFGISGDEFLVGIGEAAAATMALGPFYRTVAGADLAAKRINEWIKSTTAAAAPAPKPMPVPTGTAGPLPPAAVKAAPGSKQGLPPNALWDDGSQVVADRLVFKAPKPSGAQTGGIYRDPLYGIDVYVKHPSKPEVVYNEVLAGALARRLGIFTPDARPAYVNGKLALLSPMVQNLQSIKAGSPAVVRKANEDFAFDIWIANHDVVGPKYDNLWFTPDGVVVRLDFGGAFDRTGMGEKKPFAKVAPDIESMLTSPKSDKVANIFTLARKDPQMLLPMAQKIEQLKTGYLQDVVKWSGSSIAANVLYGRAAGLVDDIKALVAPAPTPKPAGPTPWTWGAQPTGAEAAQASVLDPIGTAAAAFRPEFALPLDSSWTPEVVKTIADALAEKTPGTMGMWINGVSFHVEIVESSDPNQFRRVNTTALASQLYLYAGVAAYDCRVIQSPTTNKVALAHPRLAVVIDSLWTTKDNALPKGIPADVWLLALQSGGGLVAPRDYIDKLESGEVVRGPQPIPAGVWGSPMGMTEFTVPKVHKLAGPYALWDSAKSIAGSFSEVTSNIVHLVIDHFEKTILPVAQAALSDISGGTMALRLAYRALGTVSAARSAVLTSGLPGSSYNLWAADLTSLLPILSENLGIKKQIDVSGNVEATASAPPSMAAAAPAPSAGVSDDAMKVVAFGEAVANWLNNAGAYATVAEVPGKGPLYRHIAARYKVGGKIYVFDLRYSPDSATVTVSRGTKVEVFPIHEVNAVGAYILNLLNEEKSKTEKSQTGGGLSDAVKLRSFASVMAILLQQKGLDAKLLDADPMAKLAQHIKIEVGFGQSIDVALGYAPASQKVIIVASGDTTPILVPLSDTEKAADAIYKRVLDQSQAAKGQAQGGAAPTSAGTVDFPSFLKDVAAVLVMAGLATTISESEISHGLLGVEGTLFELRAGYAGGRVYVKIEGAASWLGDAPQTKTGVALIVNRIRAALGASSPTPSAPAQVAEMKLSERLEGYPGAPTGVPAKAAMGKKLKSGGYDPGPAPAVTKKLARTMAEAGIGPSERFDDPRIESLFSATTIKRLKALASDKTAPGIPYVPSKGGSVLHKNPRRRANVGLAMMEVVGLPIAEVNGRRLRRNAGMAGKDLTPSVDDALGALPQKKREVVLLISEWLEKAFGVTKGETPKAYKGLAERIEIILGGVWGGDIGPRPEDQSIGQQTPVAQYLRLLVIARALGMWPHIVDPGNRIVYRGGDSIRAKIGMPDGSFRLGTESIGQIRAMAALGHEFEDSQDGFKRAILTWLRLQSDPTGDRFIRDGFGGAWGRKRVVTPGPSVHSFDVTKRLQSQEIAVNDYLQLDWTTQSTRSAPKPIPSNATGYAQNIEGFYTDFYPQSFLKFTTIEFSTHPFSYGSQYQFMFRARASDPRFIFLPGGAMNGQGTHAYAGEQAILFVAIDDTPLSVDIVRYAVTKNQYGGSMTDDKGRWYGPTGCTAQDGQALDGLDLVAYHLARPSYPTGAIPEGSAQPLYTLLRNPGGLRQIGQRLQNFVLRRNPHVEDIEACAAQLGPQKKPRKGQPRVTFLMGPAGSGKSTWAQLTYARSPNSIILDSDLLKKSHPSWVPGSTSSPELHQWSVQTQEAVYQQLIAQAKPGDHVIYDGTGSWAPALAERIEEARKAGWFVEFAVVLVPLDIALERVNARVRRGGHGVPESKIREQAAMVADTFCTLAPLADRVVLADNSASQRVSEEGGLLERSREFSREIVKHAALKMNRGRRR